MKKNKPIYIYGAIIIAVGIFLIFSKYFTFEIIKYVLSVSLLLAALLASIKAFSRERKQVEFIYHQLHAVAMVVYSFAILFYAQSFETLLYFSGILFFFYTFSEIIFCIWLFNISKKVVYKIVFIRLLLALIVGISVIVIMYKNEAFIEGFGILFIMIGINVLLYVPVMDSKYSRIERENYHDLADDNTSQKSNLIN